MRILYDSIWMWFSEFVWWVYLIKDVRKSWNLLFTITWDVLQKSNKGCSTHITKCVRNKSPYGKPLTSRSVDESKWNIPTIKQGRDVEYHMHKAIKKVATGGPIESIRFAIR